MHAGDAIDPTELQRTLAEARERKRARLTQFGRWEYLRLVDKFRDMPEGTAVFGDAAVWAYPKIGRILQLEAGIRAQFEHPFWVEEKIDGYNVRIFRHRDDLLALTRRGYLCPFTLDRLHDLLDTRILEDHPDLVLCAEVAGPGNPYNEGSPPFITEDVRAFVFDLMRLGRPGCLPYREKTRLLEAYGLPGVPQFGRHLGADLDKLRDLVRELDRQGREGIVLKEDSARDRRVKYVTGRINISDIRVNQGGIQQLPAEYFMHRIVRLALFLEEHGIEPSAALCQELGASLVGGIASAVRQFREEDRVYHTFRCRFRQHENARLMMHAQDSRLGRRLVRQRRLQQEGEFYLLEFDKVLPKTTDLLRHLLGGGVLFD